MKTFGQIKPIADQTTCVDVVAEAIDSGQPRCRGKRRNPLFLVKEHSVDLHDDCLNVAICQRMKRSLEITRLANLGSNQGYTSA